MSARSTRRRSPPARVPEARRAPYATGAVLAAFAGAFIVLAVGSYSRTSATFDEPIHLTDGYVSLAAHDDRVDPEHPPLLRMWAALPLLASGGIVVDTTVIDATPPTRWASAGVFLFSRRFLYTDNDADRLLYRGRFMMVLLGVLLGCLVFWWASEWFGFRTAVVALVLFLLEPNLAAHSTLVTTDLGVTCLIFGAVYSLWRAMRRATWSHVAVFAGFVGLAVVSKFSALILAPIICLELLVGVKLLRLLPARTACLLAAAAGASALAAIWTVYGFRYLPSASPSWVYAFHADPGVTERVPVLARLVGWIDACHLLPNVYSEGLLLGQAKAQLRAGFLDGAYSATGWWYYFPLAFLMKTPVALMIAAAAGLAAWARTWRREGVGREACVLVPVAVYLGWAMTAHINIGLRHILPIYPFVVLIGAAGLERSVSRHRVPALALAVVALATIEFAAVYPRPLTFFNVLAGGPRRGAEHLVDSNLDWGQDLKPLARWMDAHDVHTINLAYFGSADPAYYGIRCTYLPGSLFVRPEQLSAPKLPGYVAISRTLLSGVYSTPSERALYAPLRNRTPVASIGDTINVYWLDRSWW